MRNHYQKLEIVFERFSESALRIFGNSITFIIVLLIDLIWIANIDYTIHHDAVRDLLLGFTFICFFVVQKSVNKYSRILQVKLNELVSAHESANNKFMKLEEKTEAEIIELAKIHGDIEDKELE